MIPPIFLIAGTLPWLLAARCAAAYWQAMADALATDSDAPADVVPLEPLPADGRRMPPGHQAELIWLTPKNR